MTMPLLDKHAQRARLHASRDAFVAEHRSTIEPPAELLALLRPGITVASYFPVGSEADPTLLARAAAQRGATIALPHVTTRSQPMRFLAWDEASALIEGIYGLRQPHPDSPALAPDIILTPMLGFDARLERLGQGAGYYDRVFAAFPDAHRIGVAWDVQRVDALPVDPWDVPLHAVITESGWISRP